MLTIKSRPATTGQQPKDQAGAKTSKYLSDPVLLIDTTDSPLDCQKCQMYMDIVMLKFRYSKKATKIDKFSISDLAV